jgi:hypothetical protein
MKLARLQNAFQAGVLLGDSAISRSILDSRRLDRAARFKIYFDAYRFRLSCRYFTCVLSEDWLFGVPLVEAMPIALSDARDYGGACQTSCATAPWSEDVPLISPRGWSRIVSRFRRSRRTGIGCRLSCQIFRLRTASWLALPRRQRLCSIAAGRAGHASLSKRRRGARSRPDERRLGLAQRPVSLPSRVGPA